LSLRAPGPRGLPLVGNLLDYRRDPAGAMLRWARRYGRIVRFRLGPVEAHLLNHPDDVRDVLGDNHGRYVKDGVITDRMKALLGNGLLNANGDHWKKQRRLMQPAFHKEQLAALVRAMAEPTAEMLARWAPIAAMQQELDLPREMTRVTLGIVARALFSSDISDENDRLGRAVTEVLAHTGRAMVQLVPLPDRLPTPANFRFQSAKATLQEVFGRLIAERRAGNNGSGDLLSLLVAARDEEGGGGMSDDELRDEMMTLFLAGHETTANALVWTFALLSRHPFAARQIRAEVRAVLQGRAPGAAELPQLKYTAMVIQEALRLYPPIWATARISVENQQIAGCLIPAGSLVMVSPFAMHRDPSLWDNPEGFDPERFLPERNDARPRYAFYPFGGGARLCLGNHFAMMEMSVIVAMTAQRYDLRLVPGQELVPQALLTLRPRGGVRVTVHAT
jgi:cytochrome P450